jgi:nitrogen regulatory protein PII
MKAMKRIEVVVGALELEALTDQLERAGADGYTVVRNVAGKGDRGLRSDDELSDVFRNAYIVIACSPERAAAIVEAIRPFLQRYGGMCLLSDALWVLH